MTCFEPWDERGDEDDSIEKYLQPTDIINSSHQSVMDFAARALDGTETTIIDKAIKLYYAVRDGIWYFPYVPFHNPEYYKASDVIKRGKGYCVYKASLLCALGRATGIPSRVGLADVRNHLSTPKLIKFMGTDIFACHGYVEFYLADKWVKSTPAFNKELCQKHNVKPLEFNGIEDSLFHPYDNDKNQFMEYITDHGTFQDIPVQKIVEWWKKIYGKDRVESWIERFDANH